MKGIYPVTYFRNSKVNKPIEEIWNDIDSYSGEYFEDEPKFHPSIDFVIPLPPLQYKGKMTKGIFFSQGTEFILKRFPRLKELFFSCAYTMWSNYSWCDEADCYLTCYENKPREQHYKQQFPHKKDIIFIPLQDADFTNEYQVAPTFNTPKTYDVVCVSSPIPVKNLYMLAEAIKVYERKYNYRLKVGLALGDNNFNIRQDGKLEFTGPSPNDRINEIERVCKILGNPYDYITFHPYVKYPEVPRFYSSAKCTVLCSLIEGKNRSLFESMCCNTPVVAFKEHNQWARGDHPIFFGNSGELAEEFTAESLADAIHKVINNPTAYEPRKNHLIHSGRKNFIDICADYIPYYRENIPDYDKSKFHENLWIDLACQDNYQLGYHDFLYAKNPAIAHVRGMEAIEKLVNFFYSRFGIK